jgi:serine/threonine protein kinase
MSVDIRDYEIKIGDLGLAKPLTDENELSITIAGTLNMMAPEIINN